LPPMLTLLTVLFQLFCQWLSKVLFTIMLYINNWTSLGGLAYACNKNNELNNTE
jgi:hypothetical protein